MSELERAVLPLIPRRWFESRRRARRRFLVSFEARHVVYTLPGGEQVAAMKRDVDD